MDASALLKSQGWRGKGFSLHPSDNTIGLSKPILISRNKDGRGIGQKPHVTSDQWWLDAFDQKLKGLDTSKKGTVAQSVTKGKLDVVVATGKSGKYTGASGLYASFVSGGMLEGTMLFESTSSSTTDATPVSSSSGSDDGSTSSASEKKNKTKSSRGGEGESKVERRIRREARRLRKAQRATKKAAKAERAGRRKDAAEREATRKEAKLAGRATETKEERRARKLERRARKESKRKTRVEASQAKG